MEDHTAQKIATTLEEMLKELRKIGLYLQHVVEGTKPPKGYPHMP